MTYLTIKPDLGVEALVEAAAETWQHRLYPTTRWAVQTEKVRDLYRRIMAPVVLAVLHEQRRLLAGDSDQAAALQLWLPSRDPADHHRFVLRRTEDVCGISGTGVVAEGVQFADGIVAMRWCVGDHRSTVIWSGIESVVAVHGHDGRTQVQWLDGTGAS